MYSMFSVTMRALRMLKGCSGILLEKGKEGLIGAVVYCGRSTS